jgi:hypothetical protein
MMLHVCSPTCLWNRDVIKGVVNRLGPLLWRKPATIDDLGKCCKVAKRQL